MPPVLTIAVPTYNRLAELKTCIESIIAATKDVEPGLIELIISSNASDDGTDEWIATLQTGNLSFHYHRWEKNAGAIPNFLKLIDLANGDWCWLVSDDDAIAPDAIEPLIGIIQSENPPDGITLTSIPCDQNLHHATKQEPQPPTAYLRHTPPYSPDVLRAYLHDWGLITACVFPVRRWRQLFPSIPLPQGDAYPHVWLQSILLAESKSWVRITKPTILYRASNDSFLALHGAIKRALMPVTTYGALANFHENKHPAISRSSRDLCASFVFHYIVKLKKGLMADAAPDFKSCFRIFKTGFALKAWKHPKFLTRALPALLMPAAFIKSASGKS